MYLALKYEYTITLNLRNSHISIISDSQMEIQNITKPLFKRQATPLIRFIRNLSQYLLHFHSCKTNFISVLRHAGIPVNEIADESARSTPVSAPLFPLLSHLDLLTHHRNSHTQLWTTHFINYINHHSDYFRIQPSLPNKPWFVNLPSLPRRPIVSICRLRFGHHCLPATLARFM